MLMRLEVLNPSVLSHYMVLFGGHHGVGRNQQIAGTTLNAHPNRQHLTMLRRLVLRVEVNPDRGLVPEAGAFTGLFEVVHVDLRVTVPGQVTDFLVPVVTHGTPIGLKNKGVLVISKKRVKVRGAIENMPAKFDLNVEPLNRDDSILVRDIEVPANCKMMDRPDVAVCGVIKSK